MRVAAFETVLLIALAVGLVQAAIWIPLGLHWSKRNALFFADLEKEMIPYTPEELIAIAEREYQFSLSEMKKASRDASANFG